MPRLHYQGIKTLTSSTKRIIELAGQLDWRVRNGKLEQSKETIRQLKIQITNVKRELDIV